jgi:hypothetical protein
MAKTLLINREAFLNWFFDQNMMESFFHDQDVLRELISTGKFSITAKAFLDNTGYIPGNVVEPGQKPILDDNEEVVLDAYDKIKFA